MSFNKRDLNHLQNKDAKAEAEKIDGLLSSEPGQDPFNLAHVTSNHEIKHRSVPIPKNCRMPDVSSLGQAQPDSGLKVGIEYPLPIHRIPLQTTPLIGREAEFAALERLFNDPQVRLLTLTGIGGIDKTRLAIEFALRKQMDFPGGVYYIPLSSVISPEKVVSTIADVLGCRFSGSTEPKQQLLNYIASHIREETLFIFDNWACYPVARSHLKLNLIWIF